jgi:putative phage-type endonuclease
MERLLNKFQIEQLTDEWYKTRHNLITASECGSVLEANPFQKKIDVLKKKCSPIRTDINDNPAIFWGKKYEHVAFNFYQKLKSIKCYNLGLLIHDDYKWLGASPDGLTEDGKLIEIKCLYNRALSSQIPYYYWIQTQIQMEVCDIDECDFIQIVFREHKNANEMAKYLQKDISHSHGHNTYKQTSFYWSINEYNIKTIKRDKNWFSNSIYYLKHFYNDILYFRKNPGQLTRNKRKNSSSDNGISKRTRMGDLRNYVNHNWVEWVSASEIRNCMSNNEIIDWLNLYGEKNGYKRDKSDKKYSFDNYIKNKGIEFENIVLNNLEKKFGKYIIKIANSYEGYSLEKFKRTKEAMKEGIPIIYGGILHNEYNKTYGIPDLIVRSDYVNKMIKKDIYSPKLIKKPCKYSSNWHYVIIEIKYHTLSLHCDININTPKNYIMNNTIKNNESIIKCKGQIYIYNQALAKLQGYKPVASFILGRYVKKNKKKFNCFNMFGAIDYKNFDRDIGSKTKIAIKLYKKIKQKEIDITYLNVNMKAKNFGDWKTVIKNIAQNRKDITMIWNISQEECDVLRENDINSYHDIDYAYIDKNPKMTNIISKIIYQNSSTKKKYHPRRYHKNELPDNLQLQKMKYELFIDFETVNNTDKIIVGDEEILENDSSMIYMIGIIIKGKKTKYINLTVNRLTYFEEKLILLELGKILNKYKNGIVYHWSNAEVYLLKNACKRHKLDIKMNNYDLLKLYKEIPITIKGCFNFGLKSISKALYEQKMIDTKYEDTTLSGLDAMLVALIAEKECSENKIEKIRDMAKMNDIIKYNYIDCRLLLDLLSLVKKIII